MIEFIFQFFLEVIMVMPGAFIRWVFLHKTQSFKDILNEDNAYNYILSFCFIVLIVVIIVNS